MMLEMYVIEFDSTCLAIFNSELRPVLITLLKQH